MRTPAAIPADVLRLQSEVSNPDVSAFVAANAGSGKTHVLAQRVVNLMLDGVRPEKILCLTFTKAAAANMAKRVFDTLAHWTTLDDAALDQALRDRSDSVPQAARRVVARQLFARALETPGGLKVQTIHAFCTQLLHQFPFEANVAARFSVLDDAEQTQLLEQLTLAVLLDGAGHPESALGQALANAMIAAADQTFRDLIRETIRQRDTIMASVESAGGLEAAIAGLSRPLGIDPSNTRQSIDAAFFTDAIIAPAEWPTIAAALAKGSKADGEQARRFAALASLGAAARIDMYEEIFCTTEHAPRKVIVTKAITDPALLERLAAEQERVCALFKRRRAVACRDRSAALLTITYEVLTRYRKEKERQGLLDYDDLIDKTLELLRDAGAAWVHYKLDFGIDHLLIDEAQDTSSKQWQIVRLLTAEFFAGAGARPGKRTIFAVGDEKQSIYSFQNAAPKEFADMRRCLERAHRASGLQFLPRELKHSFRSGESVLGAVDEVFGPEAIAASVCCDAGGFPPHIALPDAPPGSVEIWEPEQPDDRAAIEGWDAPFDRVSETNPRVKLAQRIARTVRHLVDGGEPVGFKRRTARYGDLLILVRQRGSLFEAIIRALKNENVEVAGADRLALTEHIAVMDLMALGDALLLAEDDLALATVLRSPLFGFSEEELFALAHARGRRSLRTTLARRAPEQQEFAAAAARLDRLALAARWQTPFAFFAEILATGGRRRILGRLGAEASDALDEFLNLALEYERRQTPSLQGFLAWLREARAEVKRDMEIARDEVRVMTVHGAKGLEAPIVILADTMTSPTGPPTPRLLKLANGALIWAGRKEADGPALAAARQAALAEAEDEYRRLLYVAMTRAADRLIVCGADGIRQRPKGCWYDLVRDALAPLLVQDEEFGEKVWRYRKAPGRGVQKPPAAVGDRSTPPRVLPFWLSAPAASDTPPAAPLLPSAAFDAQSHRRFAASALDRQKALRRGRLVHRLMQSLPDITPASRRQAAERYLAKNAVAAFSADEQQDIVGKLLAIFEDENFAALFGPGSRPEVAIVGRVRRPGATPVLVSGQIDRLIVSTDAILIADYKTDRVVPVRVEEVGRYATQLALYRAIVSQLYPQRPVRAALVYTEEPRLFELPPASMDQALAEVLARGSHAAVKVP